MAVGETPRWGVSTEKALEAIEVPSLDVLEFGVT
jgi:hypothetical protein